VAREYFEAILLAVALALVLRTFVIQAFRIPSASMEDTLLVGDFLLANKFLYGAKVPFTDWRLPAIREPRPGDIIIFQYPREPGRDFVKRCVAGPGQRVEVRNKVLFVDGERAVDPPRSKYTDVRVFKRGSNHGNRDNFGPASVPPGHYFMMGDNRDNSEDSRSWGFLPYGLIKGKAFILYGSWAPDPEAPAYTGVLSVPGMVLYNLIHFPRRVRWGRIGSLVR
jgi:signal peptidase I